MAPSFGLDISDESLKFVGLVSVRDGIRIGRFGERAIPEGIIESGKIKDQKRLVEVLSLLRQRDGVRFVRVSMPEEQVYLFRLRLEKEGLENVREGIELSLEEHVPIAAADSIFDYQILAEDSRSLELQVAAIQKSVVESYLSVFTDSGLSVGSLELEAQAICRAVVRDGDMGTYMIVDFGQTRTGIFIISSGAAVFTSTLDIGGRALSGMIMKNFNVSLPEAEKMKKEYGLSRNAKNKEIFSVLLNTASVLRDEISKHFLYWYTHKDEEGKSRPPIKKIILCGGDANLIGLSDYLSVSLKTKTELADVWVNILEPGKSIPEIPKRRSLAFAAALGLALGDFERD